MGAEAAARASGMPDLLGLFASAVGVLGASAASTLSSLRAHSNEGSHVAAAKGVKPLAGRMPRLFRQA